ncbi:MAG: hypothetical protein COA95_01580 [Methylophaga sp.]|nr:MAG: hypothetical protein COA95_01580 [Methylophaga sp.]
MRDISFPYLPKDFIQTKEGLIFAVVDYQAHEGKVACFLRYVLNDGVWGKIGTESANQLLQQNYPKYCYKSVHVDAAFHAVKVSDIIKHHCPEQRLQDVLQREPQDKIEITLHKLIPILVHYGAERHNLGLTGSMLINQQNEKSDIDLVIYGREAFHKTRQAVGKALIDGVLAPLDMTLMMDNFNRRSAALSFDDFTWHESRKLNKAAIEGIKFDIGMVCLADEIECDQNQYKKQGMRTVKTTVIDDHRAFDFPAHYVVDDEMTPDVLSFTHTYVGQAKLGETIEVSGAVERNIATGKCRLIVGSSREAEGEYIKVCR